MGFAPFAPLKTWLPNASNTVQVTVPLPGTTLPTTLTGATPVGTPSTMTTPTVAPVTPVTPVTPLSPAGPTAGTKGLTGTLTTDRADIGQRTVQHGGAAGSGALVAGILSALLHIPTTEALVIMGILSTIFTFVYHLFRHKRAAAKA